MKRTLIQWLRAKTLCKLGKHPATVICRYTQRQIAKSAKGGRTTIYEKRLVCPYCYKPLTKKMQISKYEYLKVVKS